MVGRVGPSATIRCKPRQIRKEAAAAADSCAGVWLAWFASLFSRLIQRPKKLVRELTGKMMHKVSILIAA